MTHSEYDEYRPPEPPRRRRRGGGKGGAGGGGRRRRDMTESGGGDGSREIAMVEDVEFESYYGRPVVKAPPWETPIGIYLFVGGLAGASGLLQAGAALTGNAELRRSARLVAIAAVGVGTPSLIIDLGRPERFLHMMRVIKVSSPMSLGTWILSSYASGAAMTAAAEVDRMTGERLPLGPLRPLLRLAEGPSAVLQGAMGAPLAAYTAVLLGDTAVPTWNAARHGLPFVFVSSASLAAGGMAMALTSRKKAGPARLLAAAGVVGDLVGMHFTKSTMHPLESEPLEEGTPGKLLTWAERLAVAGGIGTLFARRSRSVAVASGLALAGASALTRFGVLKAGHESVKDPRRVMIPQKDRLEKRRAAGITDDSITTGW
ncbi:NrfD/PsrC family molybdoenzyme membrane anchor subunit [Brachybacterium subflavum]|uniref:NrfD/PsrC family molybdoenzyme membrane anchor subunit n=1 Tax=Brachybacterium subflavum TaxID=2585206 RepID=UPI0012663F13|nr:NrfD/PsrC family molybdoenzyme membrane anchor subunit [Brachybacterium subflavum]